MKAISQEQTKHQRDQQEEKEDQGLEGQPRSSSLQIKGVPERHKTEGKETKNNTKHQA